MKEEKEKFDSTKYKIKYAKEHYKQKKIDLKAEELEQLNQVLKLKNKTFKSYVMENVKRDLKKD